LVSVVSDVVPAQPVAAGVLQSDPGAAAAVRAPIALSSSTTNESDGRIRTRRAGTRNDI